MSRHVTFMTIDDAEHYTPQERAAIVAAYPAHEREARAAGIPVLGSGRIFPVAEELIVCEPFRLPRYWPRIGALDFGWDHPSAAVELAWDMEADVVYVSNGIWLMFDRAGDKGADGAGAGDFTGPAASVTDNIVTFAGTTGKVGKDSGVAVSSLAPKVNAVFTGTFTPPDGSITPAKLDNGAAASILGRSANSSGARADIAAGADDTILRRVAGGLGFGQMTAGMVPAGLLTYAMLASGAIASNSEFQLGTASRLLTAAALKSTVAYQALASGTTVAWDMSLGNNASLALGTSVTLSNPTNAVPQFGFVVKVTAVTSARTLSLGANFAVAAGVESFPITIATTEAVYVIGFVDTASKLVISGVIRTTP